VSQLRISDCGLRIVTDSAVRVSPRQLPLWTLDFGPWTFEPLTTMFNDLRFALRMLLKSPGFTAVAVFTLAIGIGANTLIFGVVYAVLLQPHPYRDPDRLLELWETDPQGSQSPVSAANFVDWKDQTGAFEQIAAWRYGGGGVLTGGDQPEAPMGIKISHGLMPLLGVKSALGRTFLPEDDLPGSEPVVILGHGLWTRRFGADPDLVGRKLLLNGDPIRVVGIMSPDFRFPLRLSTEDTGNRADHSLNVVARLKQGVSLEHARVELSTIAHRLEQVYPESNSKWAAQANSLHEGYLLRNIRDTILALLGAVAFLLLIACSNLTNLLLARSSARQKEISIRLALGATRWHLVRQLFAESLLLALLGGALGLLLALGGLQPLITLIPEETLVPILMLVDIHINAQVLIFTLSVSLLTSLILGLSPALVGLQFNPSHSLKGGATAVGGGMQGSGFRHGLVVCETALSLVLLMGAGLMARSFLYLQRFDPGFHPWNLLMMSVSLPAYRYTDGQKRLAFFEQLLRQVKILPGVQSVSLTDNPPPSGTGVSAGFSIEGHPIPRPGEEFKATERVIAPSFFRTLGIELLRGRDFTERDTERAPRVVIVTETMARRLWSNEDPIGKRVRLEDLRGQAPWLTIVGVAADVKDPLSTEVEPTVYPPSRSSPSLSDVVADAYAREADEPDCCGAG